MTARPAEQAILFLGDRSIPADVMISEFRRHGYAGAAVLHDWELAGDEEMVAANREHERHGVSGLADAATLAPLLAGHREAITGIVTHFFPVSADLLAELPRLRFVATIRSGTQNIDLAAARGRALEVRSNPGRNAPIVADYAVGLMLATCRGIAHAHHELLAGQWLARQQARSYRTLGAEEVGLVGFGQIGQRVARLLRGFECPVHVYDPYLDPGSPARAGTRAVASLPELLERCSLVSLHAPASPQTRHLIGQQELDWLGPDGILINTARADLVDEQALVAALQEGRIWAAGLDVFSAEPLPAGHPLRSLPQVTLSPHLAGLSRTAVPLAIGLLAGRLADLLPRAAGAARPGSAATAQGASS
jgi:D-3-phosphoglycerate dehydrogenase / 2-oxoglutarate reductase